MRLRKWFCIVLAVMFVVCVAPGARAALLVYYNFNDNVDDQTGGGSDGVIVGNASYDADIPPEIFRGKSIRFGDPADVVEVTDVTFLDGVTMSTFVAWIKPEAFDTAQDGRNMIVSKDNSFEFGFRNQQMVLRISNGTHTETTADPPVVDLDVWTHVAAVYDADADGGLGEVAYYLDGVFIETVGLGDNTGDPTSFNDTDNLLYLGNRTSGDNKPFIGLVDDLAIWDEKLTAIEIGGLARGIPPPLWNIPEPASGALLFLGSAVLMPLLRRRRRSQ